MKNNKINTYGYMVVKHNKYHMPLFVVVIYSNMVHGIEFFNNNKDANAHIQKEKASLKNYGIDLKYDYDFDFDYYKSIFDMIQNSESPFSSIHSKQIFCVQ